MKNKLYFLMTLFLLAHVSPIVAAEGDLPEQTTVLPQSYPDEFYLEKHPGVPEEQIDQFYGEFFKMITMLGLIILFLILISWFIKKMMSLRIDKMTSTSLIQVVERRPLTPRTTLYILDIAGKRIVVGETQSGITTLTELSAKAPYSKVE